MESIGSFGSSSATGSTSGSTFSRTSGTGARSPRRDVGCVDSELRHLESLLELFEPMAQLVALPIFLGVGDVFLGVLDLGYC